jgi:hypothetical protein
MLVGDVRLLAVGVISITGPWSDAWFLKTAADEEGGVAVWEPAGHVSKGDTNMSVLLACDRRCLRRIAHVPSPKRSRAPAVAPAMTPIVAREMGGFFARDSFPDCAIGTELPKLTKPGQLPFDDPCVRTSGLPVAQRPFLKTRNHTMSRRKMRENSGHAQIAD